MISSVIDDMQIDILDKTISCMYQKRQTKLDLAEDGGVLLGYENKRTSNITITDCTSSLECDKRSRSFIRISTVLHLKAHAIDEPSGYMGTWHTHPQLKPYPSEIDINDWRLSLRKNKKATKHLIFAVSGIEYIGLWLGDSKTNDLSLIGYFAYGFF